MNALLRTAAAALLPLAVGTGASAAYARPADAQTAITVKADARPGCRACRITLEREVVVGDSAGPGRLARSLLAMARDGRGRLLLASGAEQAVRVYGADGRFLRTLGDSAAGDTLAPVIGLVAVGGGDTVHLVDDLNGRHTVLTPDFAVARVRPTSPFVRVSGLSLLLPDDALVATGTVPTRDAAGYPLHVVDGSGAVLRSFGADAPELAPGAEIDLRKLAHAGPGRFWAAHLTRYAVERWTLDGRRDLALERRAPWFRPYTRIHRRAGEAPKPMVTAVRQDAAGRLWTVVRVADPRWRAARPVAVPDALRRRDPAAPYAVADLYDSVVEVFDPMCGRLLASRRWPGLIAGFLDDEHVAEWRVRGAAPPRLGVWRIGLALPPGTRDINPRSDASCPSSPTSSAAAGPPP